MPGVQEIEAAVGERQAAAGVPHRVGPGRQLVATEDDAAGGLGRNPPADDGGFPWRPFTIVLIVMLALASPAIARRIRVQSARHHGATDRIQAAWSRARTAAERAGRMFRMTPLRISHHRARGVSTTRGS